MLNHYPSCFQLDGERKILFRKFVVYLLVCIALLAALIIHNPKAALIVFVLPMLLQQYILKWGAYPHHSGLEQDDDYTSSRTHTGRFYNWVTWNAGYHAAHHFQQALHWSFLPEYHATLAGKIPAHLQSDGWGLKHAELPANPPQSKRSI